VKFLLEKKTQYEQNDIVSLQKLVFFMVLNRTRKRDGPKAESDGERVWGVNSYYYLTQFLLLTHRCLSRRNLLFRSARVWSCMASRQSVS
jgi:hypothetical protein